MKRTARILTLVLAVILLVSVLPAGAMAASMHGLLAPWLFENYDPVMNDNGSIVMHPEIAPPRYIEIGNKNITVSHNGNVVYINGKPYQAAGIHVNPYKTENGKIIENENGELSFNSNPAANGISSLTIPKRPVGNTPEIIKKQKAWDALWNPNTYKKDENGNLIALGPRNYPAILITYVPHIHSTGNYDWSYDANNHWKYCTRCCAFVYLNWHQDLDNDGTCDVCKQPIVYRNISVNDPEGGKITLSAEKGTVGNRIAVTVTADEGYQLSELRAKNNNDNAFSIRPCFEDVKGSQYHFFLDVWDVEVTAKFEKE